MKVLSTLAIFVAAVAAQSGAWGQCGGNGWTGATTCVSGYTCSVINEWYHQCVPGNGGGNNPPATTTVPNPPTGTHQATLCSQYAYHSANGYEILNNLWGISGSTGRQCTYYDGPSGNGVAISTEWTWQGDPNTVKTYIWANPIFTRKRISDITSLPTTVQWSYNITDMRANVAYDIFTDPDPNHPNSSGQFELMIWLHRYGGIWPITESSTGSPVARVTIAGYAWDFYTGWNGSMRVYSFIAANGPINSFSADVKLFFNYLIQNQGFPASNQYMLIYNFGTEAFTGGPALLRVPRFEARVN